MVKRAKSWQLAILAVLALATGAASRQSALSYDTPKGSPTVNGLSGFAKILCSAVFVSGRDDKEAATNSAPFFMPNAERAQVTWAIDRELKAVTATFGTESRSAMFTGDQGCQIQNPDSPGIHFKPVKVTSTLPSADTQAWPMGDKPEGPANTGANADLLQQAVDAVFADPAVLTQAFLVVHKGKIVAERYAAGVTKDTQLESWSMGKSLTATLFALLVKDGTYTIDQPAPVPLWRRPSDPRAPITNRH
jgi:hypothetical protein